jgi:hypothetical protein
MSIQIKVLAPHTSHSMAENQKHDDYCERIKVCIGVLICLGIVVVVIITNNKYE